MQNQQPAPTPDEIWRILREVSASQKRLAEDREKQRREQAAEQKRRDEKWEKQRRELAEIHKKQAEDRKRRAEEWEKQRRELAEIHKKQAREIDKTNKAIDKSNGMLDNKWGDLVEALAVGNLIAQLQKRGMKVNRTSKNVEGFMMTADSSGREKRRNCEIDIVAKNADELVAVEVKSTLKAGHVKRFLYVLENFHKMFPEYQRMRIRGAVAYWSAKRGAPAYAKSKGLFVIKVAQDRPRITNKQSFNPKIFCSP